jgi:hypothetical protein
LSIDIQQEQGIVLHPGWNGRGSAFVTQDDNVTHRQDVPFGYILDLAQGSIRPQERKRAFLLFFLQKCVPAFRKQRLEAGLREIIEAPPDNVFSRDAEKFTGAHACFPVAAIVVSEKNRGGRIKNDRPKELFKLLGAVFGKPAVTVRLRVC